MPAPDSSNYFHDAAPLSAVTLFNDHNSPVNTLSCSPSRWSFGNDPPAAGRVPASWLYERSRYCNSGQALLKKLPRSLVSRLLLALLHS